MPRSSLAALCVLAIALGCDKENAANDAAAAKAQTPDEAAAELCKAASEVADDPAKRNLAEWWPRAESRVTHPGVRAVVEQLAKSGSADPAEPFFAGMADVLGHPWECPAARTILEGAPG